MSHDSSRHNPIITTLVLYIYIDEKQLDYHIIICYCSTYFVAQWHISGRQWLLDRFPFTLTLLYIKKTFLCASFYNRRLRLGRDGNSKSHQSPDVWWRADCIAHASSTSQLKQRRIVKRQFNRHHRLVETRDNLKISSRLNPNVVQC
jgi:hypothetical protein